MKKNFLRGANYGGYILGCMVEGTAIGTIIRKVFSRVLTEEVKKTNPKLFYVMTVLYVATIVGGCGLSFLISQELYKLTEKIDSKIDDLAEEKEWE